MVSALLASLTLFAQAFSGTWACHDPGGDTHWQIASAPGSGWTSVRWGDQHSARGGIAYVGFVPATGKWMYEDFHYDGTYAADVSSGPENAAWTWRGSYYMGRQILHGAVVWKLSTPSRIDRTFGKDNGGSFVAAGKDYCTKLSR